MWTIEDNKGLVIHSKLRKSAEKEIKKKIFLAFLEEKENTEPKRKDLKKAINKVETTNKETQESWKQAIEGKYGSRGLKYVLRMRQNKLLLRGRLQEIGIVQNGECKVCAQKAMEEEKPIEDLRHIWRDCGIGRERKNLIVKEIAEIIQDSTSGPEWQLLHEVRREDKNVKERKEERQDPQEPDILNTFMYAGREEVQMEGEDGVKAHNVIGGEKKIDRSKKERTKQMIEISNSGVIEEIEITNLLWRQISKQNKVQSESRQLESRGKLFRASKRHIGMDQTHSAWWS